MTDQSLTPKRYSILEEMLTMRDMTLQATYTNRDVAKLFAVSIRAIQDRVASGQLTSRDLPGRARYFPADIEEFLKNSKRKPRK